LNSRQNGDEQATKTEKEGGTQGKKGEQEDNVIAKHQTTDTTGKLRNATKSGETVTPTKPFQPPLRRKKKERMAPQRVGVALLRKGKAIHWDGWGGEARLDRVSP